MNLLSNKEQLEAFMTVSDHVGSRSGDQLLLLVSGVGGTGKSHVIKSIVKLFESLGRSGSLLIGAPTADRDCRTATLPALEALFLLVCALPLLIVSPVTIHQGALIHPGPVQ